jgi:very-short-patch-repair endonuclease
MEKTNQEDKHSMHEGASPQIFTNATSLRKNMTEAEHILWTEIKDNKLSTEKFRRHILLIDIF